MLVTFESKIGRVTMLGDVAVQLIRMMGRTGTVPSALLAAEIPEALAILRKALDAVEDAPAEPASAEDEETDEKSPVSMRNRAFPLIKLLEDAAKQGYDVMWEPSGSL